MEKLRVYNSDFIESVKTREGNKITYLKYLPFKKKIFYTQKEGFYNEYSGYYYGTAEDLLNGSYDDVRILVKNNIAYYRPHVRIKFVSGDKVYKYFDTIEECNNYTKSFIDMYVNKEKQINL